ncbi:MAG: hypothetical protein FWG31_03665 [Oscillospiraceae bacterium]|nr:hypothetical protein [Oscillospiraceae bacterium]
MKNKNVRGRTWLLLGVALLVIVHVLFKISTPFSLLEPAWGAGDLITFVGTITLGYVAYWQTYKANETEDRLLKIEENRYKLELRPFVVVANYFAYAKTQLDIIDNPDKTYVMVGKPEKDTDDVLCIELSLLNTTASYVSAKYENAEIIGSDDTWSHSLPNQKDEIIRLQSGETKPLVLYAPPKQFEDLKSEKIKLRFILENRFCDRYAEYFHIIIAALDGNLHGYSPKGNWYISMFIQEYSIYKFEYKNGEITEEQEDAHNGQA